MGKEVPVPSSICIDVVALNLTLGGKTTAPPRKP